MNQVLTSSELAEYMRDHQELFKRAYKAHTLRVKAALFEIPTMQHSVKGNTISVPDDQFNKKQRWTFYLPEIIRWCQLGGGLRVTKEIVRNRDYAKMVAI